MPTPECNPLYTYNLASSEHHMYSKMLLRPPGVVSWQVGLSDLMAGGAGDRVGNGKI